MKSLPSLLQPARLLGLLGLAAAYFVAAKLGFLLAFEHPNATAVWAPTGIALAALIGGGRRFWPAVFIGAFAANVTTAVSPAVALGIAAGNTLEALLGAGLVNRFTRGREAFDRPRTVLGFTVLAGLLSTTASATIGVASLYLGGSAPSAHLGPVWLSWWLGDMGGALVIAPLLLLWTRRAALTWTVRLVAEAALLALTLALTGELVMGVPLGLGGLSAPLTFLFFSPVAWAAFRMDARATASVVFAIAAMVLWGTVRGHGPFAVLELRQSLLVIQVFLAVTATTGLVVAAGVAERRRAQLAVKALNSDLERRVVARTSELVHNEALLAEAQALVGLGSWEWDYRTRALRWSNELCRIYGVERGPFAVSLETFLERVHPEDREQFQAAIDAALGPGRPFDFRHRIIRPDGGVRVLHARGRVAMDEAGTPVRLLGTGQDVTDIVERDELAKRVDEDRRRQDRRLAEEQSRRGEAESRERRAQFLAEAGARLAASLDYRATLAEIAAIVVPELADWCGVHLLEADGTIRQIAMAHADPEQERALNSLLERNPLSVERRHGPPEVIRTGRSELIAKFPDAVLLDAAVSSGQLAMLRALGVTSSMTVPLIARGRTLGAINFASTRPDRIYGPADVAHAEELAQRAAIAADNAQLFQQAQEAVKTREDFLSIASHELRTPVTALRLQVQIVERALAEESARAQAAPDAGTAASGLARIFALARTLDEDSRRVVRLVNSLLDVTRITTGKLELQPEALDLVEVVRSGIETVRRELEQRGVELTLHAAAPLAGHWDRLRLEQVVVNLLTNAIRYGEGSPIVVTALGSGAEAVLTVGDQGRGIAPEFQESIFARFERGAASARVDGLGLGLYITREIVERHGGTIGVESRVGQGSTFTVRLPRGIAMDG